MKPLSGLIIFAGLASVATVSQAQAPGMQTPYGPDNGFFRPSRDVSLTSPQTGTSTPQATQQPFLTITSPQLAPATVPMPATVVPVPVPAAAANRPSAAVAPAIPSPGYPIPGAITPENAGVANGSGPPPAAAAQAWAERQMDRSENEADRERARMQATTPALGSAFDGTTSSENR